MQGHRLERLKTPDIPRCLCDGCDGVIAAGTWIQGCRGCEWDLCPECAGQQSRHQGRRLQECALVADLGAGIDTLPREEQTEADGHLASLLAELEEAVLVEQQILMLQMEMEFQEAIQVLVQ